MSSKSKVAQALAAHWLAHGVIDQSGSFDLNKAVGHYEFEEGRLTKHETSAGIRGGDDASPRGGKR